MSSADTQNKQPGRFLDAERVHEAEPFLDHDAQRTPDGLGMTLRPGVQLIMDVEGRRHGRSVAIE